MSTTDIAAVQRCDVVPIGPSESDIQSLRVCETPWKDGQIFIAGALRVKESAYYFPFFRPFSQEPDEITGEFLINPGGCESDGWLDGFQDSEFCDEGKNRSPQESVCCCNNFQNFPPYYPIFLLDSEPIDEAMAARY